MKNISLKTYKNKHNRTRIARALGQSTIRNIIDNHHTDTHIRRKRVRLHKSNKLNKYNLWFNQAQQKHSCLCSRAFPFLGSSTVNVNSLIIDSPLSFGILPHFSVQSVDACSGLHSFVQCVVHVNKTTMYVRSAHDPS